MKRNDFDRYLKYAPSLEERKEMRGSYWEIWQGLPDFPFKEGESIGGPLGLYYDDDKTKTSIWVQPDAYSIYKDNPNSVFYAQIRRRDDKCLDATVIVSHKPTLEDAITHARELNQGIIDEFRKEQAKKLAKRKK